MNVPSLKKLKPLVVNPDLASVVVVVVSGGGRINTVVTCPAAEYKQNTSTNTAYYKVWPLVMWVNPGKYHSQHNNPTY